jgi:hypothetical protein
VSSQKEPLVDEQRLSRSWEIILSRVPGLDDAIPDAYIQPAGMHPDSQRVLRQTEAQAVFAIAEPNPRHVGHLQVSVVTMPLEGWTEQEKEIDHYVSTGFDPLTWVLFQVAKGHTATMANIRSMSHPVTRIDEHGELQKTYPTGH